MSVLTEQQSKNNQPLLDYQLLTIPAPIQVSPDSGDPNVAALIIVVSNGRNEEVYCKKIVFRFDIGDPAYPDASYLTDSAVDIDATAATETQWQISHNNDGIFTATPKKDSAREIASQGLTFKIYDIKVSKQVGTFAFTIIEHSSITAKEGEYTIKKTIFKVAKFPQRYTVQDLIADPPVIDPGGKTTLFWDGPEDALYTLQWRDNTKDVSHVRSYSVEGLTQPTTFYLTVTYQLDEETVKVIKTFPVDVNPAQMLEFSAS